MSGLDWDLIERPNPNANPAQASRPRPKRDVVVTDGQKITVGDTTITLAVTPGHTVGSLAYLIPVKMLQGRPLTALMLSGANITPDRASLNAFNKALDAAKPRERRRSSTATRDCSGTRPAGWISCERTRRDRTSSCTRATSSRSSSTS